MSAGLFGRQPEPGRDPILSGMAAFRADPRAFGEKVRPLLTGYLGNSRIVAYVFIIGGILALFVLALLFRLLADNNTTLTARCVLL